MEEGITLKCVNCGKVETSQLTEEYVRTYSNAVSDWIWQLSQPIARLRCEDPVYELGLCCKEPKYRLFVE